ncbi:hypothetical protein GCM10017781_12330 [Deinococcus metalli]|uniref:YfhO family protein n=1 Tax=Deinococcus metalli TaxID=1141878 RepID=A0ABQ3JJK0_9DEIO|nr:hypothetical protein GCM10017781_12330 [Deinococcus metalli]
MAIERFTDFSPREYWGWWTIGTRSSAGFQIATAGPYQLSYAGYMAQFNQRLTVSLDGREIGRYRYPNKGGDAAFGNTDIVTFTPGEHVLAFRTNLSSRSGPVMPFAPNDPRDLGVALRTLAVSPMGGSLPHVPPSVQLLTSPLVITSGVFTGDPAIHYRAAGADGLRVQFGGGATRLTYQLLSAHDSQVIDVALDGRLLRQLRAGRRATVLRGDVALPAVDKSSRTHILTVTSPSGRASVAPPYLLGTSALRQQDVSFYVAELDLAPRRRSTALDSILTVLVALVVLLALWLLLRPYGRRHP